MNRKSIYLWLILFILLTNSYSHTAKSGGSDIGTIERISVSSAVIQGNGLSEWPNISRNGRYITYHSSASNLVPNDTNNSSDIFLYDRLTRTTQRVSLGFEKGEANNRSQFGDLSSDGRYLAFHSEASNLLPNDTNDTWDIFFRDLQTGEIERISVRSDGDEGNGASYFADISGNGRFITFASAANNLSPNDTNGVDDIFLHDRQTGTTKRINVNGDGIQANGFSTFPDISSDGRYIVYESNASNLVPDDTNDAIDVFLYDATTQENERISLNSAGEEGNGGASYAIISANNRYVTYISHATNIDSDDPNPNGDIYLRDLVLNTTTLISIGLLNQPTNGESHYPFLSEDGRFIVYHSDSSNLIPGDTNGLNDIFLHDRQMGTTKRINLSTAGLEGNGTSSNPAISDNGRIIVFQSFATNLVPGDTNNTADIFLYLDFTFRSYIPAAIP